MSLNQVFLIGNLGNDAEMRYTKNGLAICNFSLATTFKGKDGSDRPPEWHTIKIFGEYAESIGNLLKKGMLVHVSGFLHYHSYKNKGGMDVRVTDINATFIHFMGSSNAPSELPPPPPQQSGVKSTQDMPPPAPPAPPAPAAAAPNTMNNDDISFQ